MGADTGHSGTPLPRKLGIRPGHRVLVCDLPEGVALDELTGGVPASVHLHAGPGDYDVVVAFCADASQLQRRCAPLRRHLTTDGALWVAWPKRASGVVTDLTENVVRAHALAHGLVDVKVAAIDATWSGLKLVVRRSDRHRGARR